MNTLETTVDLGHDETVISFISRLAAANGAVDVHDFCWHLGISHQALADGDMVEIAKLMELAGVEPDPRVWRNVLRDGLFFEINGERLARSNYIRHRLRYCPHCLAEDLAGGRGPTFSRPFGRVTWCVTHLRTCPRHEVILRTAPPFESGSALDFSRMVAAEKHSVDFAKQPEHCPTSSFEVYVAERLSGRDRGDGWIDSLPLYVAARLCELVGATTLFGKKFDSARFTDADWIRASDAGFQIVAGGVEALAVFLQWLHDDFWKSDAPFGGVLLYGRLYERLAHETNDPAYDPVRRVVYEVALSNLPLGLGDVLFGPVKERRNHSVLTASKEFGIGTHILRKSLLIAKLINAKQAGMTPSRIVLPKEMMELHIERLSASFTTNEAMSHIGASRWTWDVILSGRYLAPMPLVLKAGNSFMKRDLDRLLDRAYSMVTCDYEVNRNWLPLVEASKRAGCNLNETFRFLFRGRLTKLARNPARSGLSSLCANPEELKQLSKPPDQDFLSISQSARHIAIAEKTVLRLANSGHLELELRTNPFNGGVQKMIRKSSIEKFSAEYVPLSGLARIWETSITSAKATIERSGLEEALRADQYGTAIYRRRDLQV